MTEDSLADSLVRAGAIVVRTGLVVGSGGNLSARAPEGESVRVTAAGAWLDRLDEAALPLVPWRGDAPPNSGQATPPTSGRAAPTTSGRAAPTSEFALHQAVYRVRPDAQAVIHLHPQTTVLLDSLGQAIRLMTTDHAYYVRRIGVTPFHPPGSAALADAVAEVVADGTNCVILPHHGCAVLADSVDLALRRALNLEEAARLTYRALLLTGGIGPASIVDCPMDFSDTSTV